MLDRPSETIANVHQGRPLQSLPQTDAPDVSIVMPCLNESGSLGYCITNAKQALEALHEKYGLSGEIVIADNGSSDGSQELALSFGARVVQVGERGYGAALNGGFRVARGRFLIMGDADGSYDFKNAVPMIDALNGGAGLCMGSRFMGEIKPGAMPWKNKYIGNPMLTGVLNLLFQVGVSDAHCGLRALTRDCYERLKLSGSGMEFASEMIIKAALQGERIREVPVTLSPDLRDRSPHLRPWRDGWRHLRYLFMLSPSWVFAAPAAIGAATGLIVLCVAAFYFLFQPGVEIFFGNYWIILAGATVGVSHVAAILAMATYLYGVREGYRKLSPWFTRMSTSITLETMMLIGLCCIAIGGVVLLGVLMSWTSRDLGGSHSVFLPVVGTLLVTLGTQNVLGGFLLAVIGGNEAKFLAKSNTGV